MSRGRSLRRQFTANTMATVMEFIGLSPVGSASPGATDPRKDQKAYEAGTIVMDLLRRGVRPRDLVTRDSLENAIAAAAGTGGSTNSVLHLLAIAREAEVPLAIDDFDAISRRTPIVADLKPAGQYVALDVDRAGGIQLIAKRMVEGALVHAGAPTADRAIRSAKRRATPSRRPDNKSSRRADRPFKPAGGLVILHGNLAPDGAVVKIAGHERLHHRGPARVFDREEDAMRAVESGRIAGGDVVVIRYEGPKGGPGMREMLGVTAALVGAGLGETVALVTDGRFCGRHARAHDRSRRARGAGRWTARAPSRRRYDRDRHRTAPRRRRTLGRRARPAPTRLGRTATAIYERSVREVCGARFVGVRRRDHARTGESLTHHFRGGPLFGVNDSGPSSDCVQRLK